MTDPTGLLSGFERIAIANVISNLVASPPNPNSSADQLSKGCKIAAALSETFAFFDAVAQLIADPRSGPGIPAVDPDEFLMETTGCSPPNDRDLLAPNFPWNLAE